MPLLATCCGLKHFEADVAVHILYCYYDTHVCMLPDCVLMSAGPLCAGMGGKKKKRMMYLTTKNAGKTAFSLFSSFPIFVCGFVAVLSVASLSPNPIIV